MSLHKSLSYADLRATPVAPDGFKEYHPSPIRPGSWGDWRPRHMEPLHGLGAMGLSPAHWWGELRERDPALSGYQVPPRRTR